MRSRNRERRRGGITIRALSAVLPMAGTLSIASVADADGIEFRHDGAIYLSVGAGAFSVFPDNRASGLRLSHLSNAWIYDSNPGEEELMLTWSFPIGE